MRIQLLTHPRSGSTYYSGLLERYIREYPDFKIYYEPFNIDWITKRENISYDDFPKWATNTIDDLESSNHCLVKNHMFNVLYMNTHQKDLWEHYKSLDWYTIVLVRKNVFETTMSLAHARQKDKWFYSAQDKIETKSIDIDVFDRALRDTLNNIRRFRTNDLHIPYNQIIYYEDLTSDPIKDVAKTGFVPTYLEGFSSNVKKGPKKEDLIDNINELTDYFNNYIKSNKIRIVKEDGFIDENFCNFERHLNED